MVVASNADYDSHLYSLFIELHLASQQEGPRYESTGRLGHFLCGIACTCCVCAVLSGFPDFIPASKDLQGILP